MWREIHYALRLLGKTPGFTALTLFVLAAGLGVAVYMYALIRTLAFAELPFPAQERLISVSAVVNGTEESGNAISGYDFRQMAAEQRHFEIFVQARNDEVTLSGTALPRRLRTIYSAAALFELSGVPALLGRVLQPADTQAGAPPVAVLAHHIWLSEFDGDPAIVGRNVRIDDQPVTVVGVMPPGYAFPEDKEIWLPLPAAGALQPGDGPYAYVIGRLRAGSSRAAADAELKAVAKRLEQQHPATNANRSVKVWPFTQLAMSNSMGLVAVMGAAAGAILLLVVLNAGNLLLGRAAERQKEVAIRAALGAPRLRLVRQMLWEALLLALAGGLAGSFFASWGLAWSGRELTSFSTSLPFWWQFRLDGQDLAFALALTVLTALAVGLYPALRASGGDFNAFLRDGTRGAQGVRMTRMSHGLVIAEIALSVALLIASLVLVASTRNTMQADYGARTGNVLSGEISLYTQKYRDESQRWRFAERLQTELAARPGVEEAALACHLPGMYGPVWTYLVEGSDVPDQRYPSATRVVVTDTYFKLFGIPLLEGRLFDHGDHADSARVVILSRSFADRHWPGQSALGKRIGLDREHDPDNEKWYTVIGVVGEVMYGQPQVDVASYPELYLSHRQLPVEHLLVAVATAAEPMALAHPLAAEVARLDAAIPVHRPMTLADRHYRYNAGLVFVSKLFLVMAGLGVLLAASGIYGVIARSVALRTQELGIRRALGASEARVLWLLMRQGGARFAAGAALGLALGLAMVQLLQSLLYGMEGQVLPVAAGVLVLVGGLVAVATGAPARKAVNLPPAVALRHE